MKTRICTLVALFMFFSLSMKAEWVKCKITYLNGQTKEGTVEYFDKPTQKSIKYKSDDKAKPEKIDSEVLKQLDFTFKDGSTFILMNLYPANYVFKKLKKGSSRSWFGIIYQGGLNVGGMFSQEPIRAGSLATTNLTFIYFNMPGDDYAIQVFMKGSGSTFTVNAKSTMRKTCEAWFKGKCDKLSDELKSGSFKPDEVKEIVDYYEKNCGK